MVKFQPSKLAMRVRSPLPAPSLKINDCRRLTGLSKVFLTHFPSPSKPVCPVHIRPKQHRRGLCCPTLS